MKPQAFAVVCLLSLAAASPCFAQGATLQQAISDYNNKKYADSLTKLKDLQSRGQNSDTLHYYMGLSYQGSNQIAAAKQEYALVVQGSKNPSLKTNAQTALNNLDRWSQHRSYSGQGNNFNRGSSGVVRMSSGGG